jgi:serine protease Do
MKKSKVFRIFLIGFAAGIVFIFAIFAGGVMDRLYGLPFLNKLVPSAPSRSGQVVEEKIVEEESVVTQVVEKAAPSVVTVSISKTQAVSGVFGDLFDPFGFFNLQPKTQKIEQDIGTGFVIGKEGLIVTNKHVVSDVEAKYKVVTKDDQVYEVTNIYRDPANDLAILKISASLPQIELGDSDQLKVGQKAIAIGTALGEFRQTVTVGVISGLGRGITAGSPFEGYVERLDNVIQTDAAINPGNSGGPLLNSAGQVIGVNVAVAQGGENIGFAIPINVVKESLKNFQETGQFERPFLGVHYQIISQQAALMNEVPQGALVIEVVAGSPADKAGIKAGDIIIKFNGQKLDEDKNDLAHLINQRKIGDIVKIEIWRDGENKELEVNLEKRTE